ncbi:SPC98 [[Candida] subhashii]|uniref:Spindle pole body component n=1 Tax=[Candida] subhashii TaxID=561895 RepID=A0A8J5QQQ9_9ASCO|nr:SPC98 [[Candida] subhashii]KAG7664875.1 SPC98 [[Candida] subhashii]
MALDKIQLIKVYSQRLVKSLIPSEYGEEFINSITEQFQAIILNTQPESYDLQSVINEYKAHFLNNGLTSEWSIFQNILSSLSKSKSMDQICNYLVFFNELRNKDDPLLQRHLGARGSFSSPHHQQSRFHPYQQQSQSHSSHNILPEQSFSHNDTITDIPMPLNELIKPYYNTLDEDLILKYLSYTLLGLDSKLFKFGNNHQIEIPSEINDCYISLLTQIFQLAMSYRDSRELVDKYRGSLGSAIKNAFVTLVEIKLSEYANDVNELFTTKPPTILFVDQRLTAWQFKLRILYKLLIRLDEVNGYDFLCRIYKFTKSDDLLIQELTQFFFDEIVKNYYNIIEHWILKGELVDEHQEFFISFNTDENEFNKIIQFDKSKIPSFLPLSEKIFQIGKTIIFLNKYCQELRWLLQFHTKYSNIIYVENQGLSSMSQEQFKDMINSQYTAILNYFTEIIHGTNKFLYHLTNFKRFYLMYDNHFIESLIIESNPLFHQLNTHIKSNHLLEILHSATKLSNIQDLEICNRLNARFLNMEESIAWEVFTIEYRIDELSLNFLIESQMVNYLKIFHFLWKLKHMSYLLNETYRSFTQLHKSIGNKDKTKIKKWIRTIMGTQFNMNKMLNKIIEYISFSIIEKSFKQFIIDKLFKNQKNEDLLLNRGFPDIPHPFPEPKFNVNVLTIDEIINLHQSYLTSITKSKILDDQSRGKKSGETYISHIYNLLEIIFNYTKTAHEIHDLISQFNLLLEAQDDSTALEDDLVALEYKIRTMVEDLYHGVYIKEYVGVLNVFKEDLKWDFDLKELSKSLM